MSSSGMHAVVTLGAGPAGLSFSQHFNHQTDIYEKEASWGGRCRSHMIDGFIFDEGPHSSFTKDVYVKELFAESVEDRLNEIYPKILNRFGSDWVRHPVQTNLKGLPVDLVVSCILDFVKAERSGSGSLENYGQWLIDGFGEKFARTFPYAYTRKYWTVEPEQMTTNWIEQRIYRPDLEQVLKGALSSEINSNHYISTVRYPGRGGFQSFLRGLQEGTKAYYGYELVELDVQKRRLLSKTALNAIMRRWFLQCRFPYWCRALRTARPILSRRPPGWPARQWCWSIWVLRGKIWPTVTGFTFITKIFFLVGCIFPVRILLITRHLEQAVSRRKSIIPDTSHWVCRWSTSSKKPSRT